MSNTKGKVLKFLVIATTVLLIQLLFIVVSFASPEFTETARNGKGQAVGYFTPPGSSRSHGFIRCDGITSDIGTLGGNYCEAIAINENGQVVGCSSRVDGEEHAFIWYNGNMTDLGTLGGIFSCAYGINNKGQVVGYSETTDAKLDAFIWDSGKMTDLDTLGGDYSCAYKINENGQVLGEFYPAGSSMYGHGFIWENDEMTDLGTLGGPYSYADSIDENGQVYGISNISEDSVSPDFQVIPSPVHKFIWNNGIMTDLDDKFPVITINSYDTTPSSNNITVTASVYEGTLNETSHTFTYNGSFTFIGTDTNGNISRVTVTISNIIKPVPIITINPYDTNPTNKDITVSASVYGGILNETSHTFTQNGSFTFIATSPDGGTGTKTVRIANIDKDYPAITLSGSPVEYIRCGEIYSDMGANAKDYTDGDITSFLIVSGSVNTNIPAEYSVVYSVYDKAGNAAIPVARTVIVTPDNLLIPDTNMFDLAAPVDIKIMFSKGSKLLCVKNGPSSLTNWDYSVTDNTVTIKKSYLIYFFTKFNSSNQKLYLTFDFDTGNDPAMTIERTFSSNTLKAANTEFDPSNPQDITVTVTGNKLNSIKNGPANLTNWDYSISDDAVTIKKSYLVYFFTKFNSPEQKLNLTFDFDLANDPVFTITRKQIN